jgi:hypothetical protein
MAYFTPTQEWIRGMWTQGNPNRAENQGLMGAPQLPMAPMTANFAQPDVPPQMDEPKEPTESPIAKGLSAGLQAGRQSREINDSEKDRLAGLMLFNMFSGLGNASNNPNPTVMGSLSEGLRQGMPEYQKERANIERLNQMEMERQDALAKEMQRQKERQKEQEDLNKYRNATIELQKQKNKESQGGYPQAANSSPDVIPLSRMPKGAQTEALKDMRERAANGLPLHNILSTLDKMQKLSDDNPHLGNSFALAFFSEKDNKGVGRILKNITLGKDRAAVEEYGKLTNFLLQKQIKATKGPASDRLKKIYQESTPSAGLTKESQDYIIKTFRDETLPYYDDAISARKGMLDGNYVPVKLQEYTPPSEKKAEGANNLPPLDESDPKVKAAREANWSDEKIQMIMQE